MKTLFEQLSEILPEELINQAAKYFDSADQQSRPKQRKPMVFPRLIEPNRASIPSPSLNRCFTSIPEDCGSNKAHHDRHDFLVGIEMLSWKVLGFLAEEHTDCWCHSDFQQKQLCVLLLIEQLQEQWISSAADKCSPWFQSPAPTSSFSSTDRLHLFCLEIILDYLEKSPECKEKFKNLVPFFAKSINTRITWLGQDAPLEWHARSLLALTILCQQQLEVQAQDAKKQSAKTVIC